MKKLLAVLILIILLAGCAQNVQETTNNQEVVLENESRMRNMLENDPRYEYDEALGKYVRIS